MKLIVADLDGTLIHRSKFSDKTLETIIELQHSEHLFTLATGRHLNATREIAKKLNIKYPVICSNGAIIYDFKEEKFLFQKTIESDTAIEVIRLCESLALDYLVYTTTIIYAGTPRAYKNFTARVGTFNVKELEHQDFDELKTQGVTKILVIENQQALLDQLKNKLSKYIKLSYVQSQPTFLDIGHKDANKGNALNILASYLKVSREECVAIGDQENDMSMIEFAGIGIAMGSGKTELKEMADFVTKPFEEDGFTYAMNQLIFKNK
jgi:Cof subfamily protein (haloacid dehalogenase superfamily)